MFASPRKHDTQNAAPTVVGYVNKADFTGDGYYDNAACCFEKIDASKVNLGDFTVSGYADKIGEPVISIVEIGGTGIMDSIKIGTEVIDKKYDWVECIDEGVVIMPAGWYDNSSRALVDASKAEEYMSEYGLEVSPLGDAAGIEFEKAGGFRVIRQSGYDSAVLNFNGQVGKQNTEFNNFRGGGYYDLVGNNTPVTINLGQMYVEGDSAKIGEPVISIAEIGKTGIMDSVKIGTETIDKKYDWVECIDEGVVIMPAGWYDNSSRALVDASKAEEYMSEYGLEVSPLGDAAGITFAPGDAFRAIQQDGYEDAYLVIPAPAGL